MKPENTLNYVKNSLYCILPENEKIDKQILKSALIYQCLYYNEFKKILSIDEILLENSGEIGLIGPGSSCLTIILEKLFGKIKCCHLHSALHDAYGRFYAKYHKGPGYCYILSKTPRWLKNHLYSVILLDLFGVLKTVVNIKFICLLLI